GNSGGPLFNMEGQVIGVNTAILSPNGGSIGIGFSMASNVVVAVVEQLRQFGETRRGWLVVRIQPVDPSMAEALGLESALGALVADVTEASPAEDGGVLTGDVILQFDGEQVEEMRDLPRMVAETPVGKEVEVIVFREGETVTLAITLGRLEEGEVVAERDPGETAPRPDRDVDVDVLGMTLSQLSERAREQFGLNDEAIGVVVVDVAPDSQAFEKGMRPGDLVLEVGQEDVRRPRDVARRVEAARDAGRNSILLLVQREGEPRFVALRLEE
ncbi:MAG: PDZ domain-containing protein, partial [Pseudomonadota bacterium]